MDITLLALVVATANLVVLAAGAVVAICRTARMQRHVPERRRDRRTQHSAR
jgi:hypothetical protein